MKKKMLRAITCSPACHTAYLAFSNPHGTNPCWIQWRDHEPVA